MVDPKEINKVIMTCYRSGKNYLYDTLSQLSFDPSWILANGSISKEHIPPQFYGTVQMLPQLWLDPNFSTYTIYVKACLNYINCLQVGDPTKWSLILEDDVLLTSNFTNKVTDILTNKANLEIIALYACYNWATAPVISNTKELVKYPTHDFYGTQAMLYSPEARRRLIERIKTCMHSEPYDFSVKHINFPISACKNSLVQHRGELTTGLGHFHMTENFLP